MLLVKNNPSNVISDNKKNHIFFGDIIGYRILFSDKKTIPEMILVSRKKTGRASDDKKNPTGLF